MLFLFYIVRMDNTHWIATQKVFSLPVSLFIYLFIYIYTRYTSPRWLVHHSDQAIEPATVLRARDHDRTPRDRLPRRIVQVTPRWSRRTSHGHDLMWLSHFSLFAQPFLIKRKLFLSSWSVILLHRCYSAILLQYSAILENSVIFCCYNEHIHSFCIT
jgi:hypothetical protein